LPILLRICLEQMSMLLDVNEASQMCRVEGLHTKDLDIIHPFQSLLKKCPKLGQLRILRIQVQADAFDM
jgi:hypothetical protein